MKTYVSKFFGYKLLETTNNILSDQEGIIKFSEGILEVVGAL